MQDILTPNLTCRECGEPMFIDDNGVSYHGREGEIDHEADADHVAVSDAEDAP